MLMGKKMNRIDHTMLTHDGSENTLLEYVFMKKFDQI